MKRISLLITAIAAATSAFGQQNAIQATQLDVEASTPGVEFAFEKGQGDFLTFELQADGKILVRGAFKAVAGVPRNGFARLNADGTLDTMFIPAGTPQGDPTIVETLPNGKMLIGGWIPQLKSRLARLNPDGSLDKSFKSDWKADVISARLLPDGKILFAGTFSAGSGLEGDHVIRLKTDGTMDSAFKATTDYCPLSSLLQTDGRIIIWRGFNSAVGALRNRVVRLNADGSTDQTFKVVLDGDIKSVELQQDGSIAVTGQFKKVNDVPCEGFAIIQSNGILRESSTPKAVNPANPKPNPSLITKVDRQNDGKTVQSEITNLTGKKSQPDGKVMALGVVTIDGTPNKRLFRFNEDGSIDRTFGRQKAINKATKSK